MQKNPLNQAPYESVHGVLDGSAIFDTVDGNETSTVPSHHNVRLPESVSPMLCRLTILVVDDEQSIAQLLYDVLGAAGYRVLIASNGRSALATARREHPALVLTDRMMPELDGLQFAHRLRANASTRDIPIIVMSSTRPDREAMGDIPFLAKPFDLDDLLATVATNARNDVVTDADCQDPPLQ